MNKKILLYIVLIGLIAGIIFVNKISKRMNPPGPEIPNYPVYISSFSKEEVNEKTSQFIELNKEECAEGFSASPPHLDAFGKISARSDSGIYCNGPGRCKVLSEVHQARTKLLEDSYAFLEKNKEYTDFQRDDVDSSYIAYIDRGNGDFGYGTCASREIISLKKKDSLSSIDVNWVYSDEKGWLIGEVERDVWFDVKLPEPILTLDQAKKNLLGQKIKEAKEIICITAPCPQPIEEITITPEILAKWETTLPENGLVGEPILTEIVRYEQKDGSYGSTARSNLYNIKPGGKAKLQRVWLFKIDSRKRIIAVDAISGELILDTTFKLVP